MATTNPIKSNTKLRLSAKHPKIQGVFCQMSYDIYNNNPRIIVDTKDPNLRTKEMQFGRFQAAMDLITFYEYLELIEASIKSNGECKFKIENYGFPRGSDAKSLEVISSVWVGKDAEGQIFVSLIPSDKSWPEVKFIITSPDKRFHKFYRGNGTEFTPAEQSALYAKGHLRVVRAMVAHMAVSHFVEPQPFQPRNAQNKQQHRQSSSNSSVGDDIPF